MRRRRKSHVFRRKSRLPQALLTIILLLGLVAAGYYGAQYVANMPKRPATSSPGTSTTSAPDTTAPPATTTTSPPETSPGALTLERVKAFYLPYTALRQLSAYEPMLKQAVQAGYNGVVFDAKDQQGNIRYQSATPLAAQAKTITEDALTPAELKAAFA